MQPFTIGNRLLPAAVSNNACSFKTLQTILNSLEEASAHFVEPEEEVNIMLHGGCIRF